MTHRHHPAGRAPDPSRSRLDEEVELTVDLSGSEHGEPVQSEARRAVSTTVNIHPWPPRLASVKKPQDL